MRIETGFARTVLGDVPVGELGRVNTHEHAFQVSPLLPGDELRNEASSAAEFSLLRGSGFESVVDATPLGLGRQPEALARVARASGMHVIATTGMHRDGHYAGSPLLELSAEERASVFVRDIAEGMPAGDIDGDVTDVRAGIAKVGIDYWKITASESATIEAVAAAHEATGVPILVHLEFCTAAHEVLDRFEAFGVAAEAVMLSHADRNPDPGLHHELMARGAWLGYDGMARPKTRTDDELLELTARVLELGVNRVMLGGDVARSSRYVAYGGMPGLQYLGDRYLPRLRERVGDEAVTQMLTTNPATWLN